jgi:hypothetical protein
MARVAGRFARVEPRRLLSNPSWQVKVGVA